MGLGLIKEEAQEIAAAIYKAIEGEASARAGYAGLLGMFSKYDEGVRLQDVFTLREISGDESNHTIKLIAMARYYDGVGASTDGLSVAISDITEGVCDDS